MPDRTPPRRPLGEDAAATDRYSIIRTNATTGNDGLMEDDAVADLKRAAMTFLASVEG